MISLLLAWIAPPTIHHLDVLAQQKDVAGLERYLVPRRAGERGPLSVIKTGGPYEGGRFGWHAGELPGYVVFWTPLTAEDTGDLLFQREGDKLKYIPEEDRGGVEILRHLFDVSFDVAGHRVKIEDRLAIKILKTQKMFFRLSSEFVVDSISNQQGSKVSFHQAGGVVLVSGLESGPHTLTIRYSGVVNHPRYSGAILESEASLTNDVWYPMIGRQPALYDITVHAPAGWTVIGQGNLISDVPVVHGHTVKYQMDLPVVVYSLSLAPYKEATVEDSGFTLHAWGLNKSVDELKDQAQYYGPILATYSRFFGPAPFSHYGGLESATYGGGALEAYSYATYGGGFPYEDAHEPSHTWWGGLLNNTYLHSFWNESFAVFSEGLYARQVELGNKADREVAFISEANASPSYDQFPCSEGGADVGPIADDLGYGKGGFVLQMLEQILGTDGMTLSMRRWVEADHGKAVTWEDYERVLYKLVDSGEVGMGIPAGYVKRFMDQWIHQTGYGKLTSTSVTWADGKLSIKVGCPAGAPDVFPLDVMVVDGAGKREFHTVLMNGSAATALLLPTKPSSVVLDPWRRLLRIAPEGEQPVSLDRLVNGAKLWSPNGNASDIKLVDLSKVESKPSNLNRLFVFGRPEDDPAIADLWKRAGVVFHGDDAMFRGQTVNLDKGGVATVVDLPEGGRCVVAAGKCKVRPNFGHARSAIFDQYGRFLAGATDPTLSKSVTFTP